jgi:aspartate aminotransferase
MSGFQLSAALSNIQPSATIAITQLARDLRVEGRDVISLSIGEPDHPTPGNIVEAAHQAMLRGETKYPPVSGIPELKDAVRRKFARDNSLEYTSGELIVSAGCKQIIAMALMATLDPGDEVIIPTPYYVSYLQLAKIFGATSVFARTSIEDGFLLQPHVLEQAITPKTKWLLLNSPGNPSGAVYGREALAALTDVLLRHPRIMVLADDIYEHLIYDRQKFWTVAEVEPRLRDRTLTANGVSKAYAMTGWRIGYAGGPAALVKGMELAQSQITGGACRISQWAAAEALDGPQDSVRKACEDFQRRRELVVTALNRVAGIECRSPEGAFYAYPSCRAFLGKTTASGRQIDTDQDFCMALLADEGVAAVHGGAFGLSPHFRISFAASEEKLVEACKRLTRFCHQIH